MKKKLMIIGYISLLLFAVGDFLVPYFLGPRLPNYDPLTSVISLIGKVGSPTQHIFAHVEIVTGTLALIGAPAVYETFVSNSRKAAVLLAGGVAAFGIGECIFTGVFSVNHQVPWITLGDLIHGAGSGIGLVGLLIFPYILARCYRALNRSRRAQVYLVIFAVALVTVSLDGLSQLFKWHYRGLIQRISFVFIYLPPAALALDQLKQRLFQTKSRDL